MTEASHLPGPIARNLPRTVSVLALCVLLSACTRDDDTDFCKNHYRFHQDHLDTVAALRLELNGEGVLTGELTLPRAILESAMADSSSTLAQGAAQLGNAENVFRLQSEAVCTTPSARIEQTDGAMMVHYQSDCGARNKIGQIDISLFDHVPELDEVVVDIATPATAKHFAISRQCSSAIFRLESH